MVAPVLAGCARDGLGGSDKCHKQKRGAGVSGRINVKYATRHRASVWFYGAADGASHVCAAVPGGAVNLSLRMLWRPAANFAREGRLQLLRGSAQNVAGCVEFPVFPVH